MDILRYVPSGGKTYRIEWIDPWSGQQILVETKTSDALRTRQPIDPEVMVHEG